MQINVRLLLFVTSVGILISEGPNDGPPKLSVIFLPFFSTALLKESENVVMFDTKHAATERKLKTRLF
jgi:hypothetical protein